MHYVSTNLPYQDAKVASKLCIGGPVKYTAREGANVTNAWLLQYVVPHIAQRFSEQFALTLAFPILWACYDGQCSIPIPPTLKNRVRAAYEMVRPNNLPAQQNPVEKKQLVIVNDNGTLTINEAGRLFDINNQQNGVNPATVLQLEQELCIVSSQLAELTHAINQVQASGQRNEAAWQQIAVVDRKVGQINAAVQRFAAFPVVPIARRLNQQQVGPAAAVVAGPNNQQNDAAEDNDNNTAANSIPYESSLSPRPQNLYELWNEYQHGIGGRKAAKNFTRTEKGRVKCTYTRRKVIWDEIDRLVRAGDTYLVAIDRIYQAYGQTLSVSRLSDLIREDRKTGRHPALRV